MWTILIAYLLAGNAPHKPLYVGSYASKEACEVANKAVKPKDYPGFVSSLCIPKKDSNYAAPEPAPAKK